MGKARQQIGRTWKQYKYSIIVIFILLTFGLAAIAIDWIIPPNPNQALYNEMPELEESENGYLRLYRSGVSNVTSTQEVTIEVWANSTFYLPTTGLYILYYNGTNEPHYNASESHNVEDNFFNFRNWWTDYDVFFASGIASNDSTDRRSFVIPTQKAGSEIIIQICIRQWNVSSQSYLHRHLNSTYTVLYSTAEVSYQQTVQTTTAVYLLAVCGILSLTFLVWRPFQIIEPSPQKTSVVAKKDESKPYSPNVELLVDRCNHLDGMRVGLRTGSSLLMAIGIGLIAWLSPNQSYPVPSFYLPLVLIMGGVMMVLGSFGAIILSFHSLEVSIEERSIGVGLVPDNCTKDEYIELLSNAAKMRESILNRMTASIGFGVVQASALLIIALIVLMLPDPIYLAIDWIHQGLYSITITVIFLFAIASVLKFFKWIGIVNFRE